MVVLSLYAMIILTGLFQSINPILGLRCYQCNHPGTYYGKNPCESKSCDDDPFHKQIKQRFYKAIGDLDMTEESREQLQLDEYCYLKVDRPIPFDGHSRGCFIHLKFNDKSLRTELDHHPMYEEWLLCKTDNCNDMDIPKHDLNDEPQEIDLDDDGEDDEMPEEYSSARSTLYSSSLFLDKLPFILTMVLILTINHLRFSYYLGYPKLR